MATAWSNDHIECIFDGSHRVVGLADVEEPYEFINPGDFFEIMRSRNDGGMYVSANAGNILGGGFKLMLMFGSPTLAWCIERRAELQNAILEGRPIRTFSMTFRDPVQGRSNRAEGGVIQDCPHQAMTGVDGEVLFEFELIQSNNAGAAFEAPRASA